MDDNNATTTPMQQKRMAAEPVGRPISLGSPGSSVTSRRNGLDFSAPFAGGAEDDRGEIGAAVDSETPTTTRLQIGEEMVLLEDLPFIAGSRRYAWRADHTRVWFEPVWTSLFRESMGRDSVEQIIGRLVLQQDRVKLVVLKGF